MQQKSFAPDFEGMLHSLRVIDLSRVVAGNMLTLQLADHGADVIKIEPLPAGDPLRAWKENGYSAYWKIYARNKRSLGLNFRAKERPTCCVRWLLKPMCWSRVFGLAPWRRWASLPPHCTPRILA